MCSPYCLCPQRQFCASIWFGQTRRSAPTVRGWADSVGVNLCVRPVVYALSANFVPQSGLGRHIGLPLRYGGGADSVGANLCVRPVVYALSANFVPQSGLGRHVGLPLRYGTGLGWAGLYIILLQFLYCHYSICHRSRKWGCFLCNGKMI